MIDWPPTPTPLPPGIAKFDMGDSYSLWSAAPTAIQVWNWTGIIGTVLQLILLVGVVIIGGYVVYKAIARLTDTDYRDVRNQ